MTMMRMMKNKLLLMTVTLGCAAGELGASSQICSLGIMVMPQDIFVDTVLQACSETCSSGFITAVLSVATAAWCCYGRCCCLFSSRWCYYLSYDTALCEFYGTACSYFASDVVGHNVLLNLSVTLSA